MDVLSQCHIAYTLEYGWLSIVHYRYKHYTGRTLYVHHTYQASYTNILRPEF